MAKDDPLRSEIRKLERPSTARYLGRALGNWAEIGAIFLVAHHFWNPPVVFLCVLLLGTRQHALAMLGHDGAHRAVSRNRTLNDAITSLLVFYPIYGGLDGYRHFHFSHHRLTGRDEDPEFAFKRRYPADWDLPLERGRLFRLLLLDLSGWNARQLLQVGALAPPRSLADRVGPLLWHLGAAWVLWKLELLWIAPVWVWAFLTSHWAVFRLRVWTEHTGTRGTHRIRATWLERLLIVPHNTWYHWEHHRFPGVPCWNLPAVRDLLGAREVLPLRTLFELYRLGPRMPASIPED